MKVLSRVLVTSLAVAAISSCSTSTGTQPMQLCSEIVEDARAPVDLPASRKQMKVALARAQEYSDLIYGSDCNVCAEVLPSEKGKIKLHITSPLPGEDDVNTSAGIEVQARDGTVLRKTQWHSCHARTGKK